MALTSLAIVRQSIPRLASVADAEINRLIDEASDIIETYLNRTFAAGTHTETLDADLSGRLFLSTRPVSSITSISTGPPDFATTLDPTTYLFDPDSGEVRYGSAGLGDGWFPDAPFLDWYPFWGTGGWQSVRVVYQAGYATIPPAVAGRCLAVINRAAAGLAMSPAIRSKTLGNASLTFADAAASMTLTDDDRKILSRYKVWM
jgi:hypothetical protein